MTLKDEITMVTGAASGMVMQSGREQGRLDAIVNFPVVLNRTGIYVERFTLRATNAGQASVRDVCDQGVAAGYAITGFLNSANWMKDRLW